MNAKTSIATALVLASLSAGAYAADQADVEVTASVINNCAILGTQDINFGALDPAQANNVQASGSVNLACTKNVEYTLTADMGQNSSGGARRMQGGTGSFLPYELAQASFSGQGGGFSTPASIPLSASISGSDYRDLPADAYADTIRLTVTP